MDIWHLEVACRATHSYRLEMTTKAKPNKTPKTKRTLTQRIKPRDDADRFAVVAAVIDHIPAAGSAAAACRIAHISRDTFYTWLGHAPAPLRDRYQSALQTTTRLAVDVMAAITARAGDRTLDATADDVLAQEEHYSRFISPLVRWKAEKTLPEYAPRTETVSVRIDIRSTLAQMIDSVDAGGVIDADDLPALPAPGDYAGD